MNSRIIINFIYLLFLAERSTISWELHVSQSTADDAVRRGQGLVAADAIRDILI